MKLSGSDAAVSAAVILGACGLLYLFAMDINSTALRSGEKALGTVVFKKLTATRKAPSGLGWERMRNNSPVYEADTLRTAGFSEAAVFFEDGTNLDMLENSMLKLDIAGPKKNLEFLSGEIDVGSSREASSYTISSTAGTITIDKGSKASFSRSADALSVEVSQGQASITRRDGSSQAIAKNQEVQVNLKSGETQFVQRPIVPLRPERNARLLSYGEGSGARLDFSWELDGAQNAAAKGTAYTLEISNSRGFESTVASLRVTALAASSQLADGVWYWRVRGADGKATEARRFSLTTAQAPRPAFPADQQAYSFRRLKPDVRFAWTGMEAASAYLFELSSEPSFAKPLARSRTSTASLTVNGLGEGNWYWRVRPIHAFEIVGADAEAQVRRVVVKKDGAMQPPGVTAPFEGSLYQVQELDGKGLAFSWVPVQEAVSYELLISAAKDLSSPIAVLPAREPYIRLSGKESSRLKEPGEYFWGLRWLDREGNASPLSAGRSLRGVDGSIAVRLSFPPDGYRIADSLVADTRFAWKSNIPARTVFQLARDADFKDLAYQETVSAETLIGHAWKSGPYFWRLRAYNTDGSVFLETKPRGFVVVDPFEGPPLLSPNPGSAFYLREHDTKELAWQGQTKADYYSFKLFSSSDGYARPVFERTFLQGTKLVLDLGDLPGGTYKASVQGFAAEKEDSTRIIGYIGDSFFTYKRLSYIKLGKPGNGAAISGLSMKRAGAEFTFEAPDRPDSAELLISQDARGEKPIASATGRSGSFLIKGLSPGYYYWTVRGELAGFDISSKDRFRFGVDAIPPLPGAELLSPARGFEFGPVELRQRRSIVFSWKPVPGATHYALAIKAAGQEEPIIRVEKLDTASYAIEDLSVLDKGDYTWWVEAFAYSRAGELEQDGLDSRSAFAIRLPALQKAKASGDGKVYGR